MTVASATTTSAEEPSSQGFWLGPLMAFLQPMTLGTYSHGSYRHRRRPSRESTL